MREYILSVCAAAVTTAILRTLAGKGTAWELLKMLSGLFLAVTVMAPLVHLELPDPANWISDYTAQGREAAAAGEKLAENYSAAIISAEVEAYILDKANRLGADLDVEVTLDGACMPVMVTLTGGASPSVREELSRCLEAELGMGEEAVSWLD